MRVVKHWNRLHRDVADSPSLDTEQPDLVKDVPAHSGGGGVGLDDL